ncbi:MAG: tetratricopeptide repeat protein [Thiotrichales bacterium]
MPANHARRQRILIAGGLACAALALLGMVWQVLFSEVGPTVANRVTFDGVVPDAKHLRQILARDPDHAEARYQLGLYALESGEPVGAERDLRRALAAGWAPRLAAPALAKAMLVQGDYARLLQEDFGESTLPTDAVSDLHAIRAQALWASGRIAEAQSALASARALDPTALEVYLAEVSALLREMRSSEALAVLETARTAYPDARDLENLTARIHLVRGENAEALASFSRILGSDEGAVASRSARLARLWVVELNRRAGRFDLAEAQLESVFEQDPDDLTANFLSGVIAFERKRFDVAQQRLLRVVRRLPGHHPSLRYLARIGVELGRFEQAGHFLQRIIYRFPDDHAARGDLARLNVLQGDLRSATSYLSSLQRPTAADARLTALVQNVLGDAAKTDGALHIAAIGESVGADEGCLNTALALRLINNSAISAGEPAWTSTGVASCAASSRVAVAIANFDWRGAVSALPPLDAAGVTAEELALAASLKALSGDGEGARQLDETLARRLALTELRRADLPTSGHDLDILAHGVTDLNGGADWLGRGRQFTAWGVVTQGFVPSHSFAQSEFQDSTFAPWSTFGDVVFAATSQDIGLRQSASIEESPDKPLIYRPLHSPSLPPPWAIAAMMLAIAVRWRAGRRQRASKSFNELR